MKISKNFILFLVVGMAAIGLTLASSVAAPGPSGIFVGDQYLSACG